jgi:lipopolysaccharide transport system ATP-binding protein
MPNPVISVEHLTKRYELGVIGTGTLTRDLERWWARVRKQPDPYTRIGRVDAFKRIGESILALDDVSFKVEQGEALGIIGRNGAGKSTLLKILSRVTAPTSGVVKVKGRIGSLLEVGTGFHPELTGRENIYLNGAILGMKKAEVARKFDEIVDFSGVEKFIDTPVKRYSSGMYVRLAFAVAAHLDPEILVVDEVLAVGDAEFQKKCLGKMGDVATREGRTVLFVSHNMAAIQQLCSKSILIRTGKLDHQGDSQSVVKRYLLMSENENEIKANGYIANNILEKIRLIDAYTTDTTNNLRQSLISGEEINLNLVIESETNFRNLIVTVGINDDSGSRLTVLHSELSGASLQITSKQTIVTCNIPKFILLPGKYYLDIKIYRGRDVLMWIPNAKSITVEQGNVLKSGKLPPRDWGGFFVLEHLWQISSKNDL